MHEQESSVHETQKGPKPYELEQQYQYAVIMPYSANLKEKTAKPDATPEPRMSFFTSFATNAALEWYKDTSVQKQDQPPKFLLCGEATFGPDYKTTNDLTKEALIRQGVPAQDIIIMQADHLENTAFQIEAVARWQKEHNLKDDKFLVLDWQFHDDRIRNNIAGYGLNAQTLSVERLHKYYHPEFNDLPLQPALDAFAKRESNPVIRPMSKIDKKSRLLRFITAALGRGGSVTDVKVTHKEFGGKEIALEDTTGKKKLADFKAKMQAKDDKNIVDIQQKLAQQSASEPETKAA